MNQQPHIRGYCEGYYGKLLTWQDRSRLLEKLQSCALNCYLYAPKEDRCHRFAWREPYPEWWEIEFTAFCRQSETLGIQVFAGVAPGLDFDFADLPDSNDYNLLLQKCNKLLACGAYRIVLLMDDIDANFPSRCGAFTSEGAAHATLANQLASSLGQAVGSVPRIYANELSQESPDYLNDFVQTLNHDNHLYYSGKTIVARRPHPDDASLIVSSLPQRVIMWDNLYANDYCPKRLFTGAWVGRDGCQDIVLNPTGMIETDLLLLDLMCTPPQFKNDPQQTRQHWQQTLTAHEVPDSFHEVSGYFDLPHFSSDPAPAWQPAVDATFAALEELLWRWKTPLSREWYPYLLGLKQDLLLERRQLPAERVYKTQSPALARYISSRS